MSSMNTRKCWEWRVVSYSLSNSEEEIPAAVEMGKDGGWWTLVLIQETEQGEEQLIVSKKTELVPWSNISC